MLVHQFFRVRAQFTWEQSFGDSLHDEEMTASSGGTELTLSDLTAGLTYTLVGSGLSADIGAASYGGTFSSLRISGYDSSKIYVDVTLPTDTSLLALYESVQGGMKHVNQKTAPDFYDLLMPESSPYPDLTFTGHKGSDIAEGFDGDDSFALGGGRDVVYATSGNDSVSGGRGIDSYDAKFLNTAVDLNLKTGIGKIGTFEVALRGIENLYGTKLGDTLGGSSSSNILEGRGGRDKIHGNEGNDTIRGGAGNDELWGGSGRDRLFGGAGSDLLEGGPGNDRLYGGAGEDLMYGEKGNDRLVGGAGDDFLTGGAGDDHLDGGASDDALFGGPGNDRLTGGAGDDMFVFPPRSKGKPADGGTDHIRDYQRGKDSIELWGEKKADVSVTIQDGDTHITYSNGEIILDNVELTRDQIIFDFGM